MPTLQELTLAHSQLRALPAAARAYQKYDDELAVELRKIKV